jgi:hypothetical protein
VVVVRECDVSVWQQTFSQRLVPLEKDFYIREFHTKRRYYYHCNMRRRYLLGPRLKMFVQNKSTIINLAGYLKDTSYLDPPLLL